MARVFNCGIGMVIVVAPDRAEEATRLLTEHGETVHRIGKVVPRAEGGAGCVVTGIERLW
jgi:phosphoribosylformylglycinamidine cyclo-ligase